MRRRVATMGKPTESVLGSNEKQRLGNSLLESFSRTSAPSTQKRLHFGESLFNRGEIGRIRRQEQEVTTSGFDSLSHARSLMNAQIIQDHDLSGAQAGSKQLLYIDLKSGSIRGSIQDEGFSHPLGRQRSDQRHDRSIVARNRALGSLPSGSIGIQRGHSNMGAGLIDKHQIRSLQLLGLLTPGRTSCMILLACYERLFFRVQPRATLARLMLAVLTSMPCSAWNSRQCSSRVASGWASNCALKWACNTAPFLAGRPGIAFGNT